MRISFNSSWIRLLLSSALIALPSMKGDSAPVISNARFSNNRFTFTLVSTPGQYTLQYSTDLFNWSNIVTTNLPDGTASFAFPTTQWGFYRAMLVSTNSTFIVSPSALTFYDPATLTLEGFPVQVPDQIFIISNSSPNAITLVISNNCPVVGDPDFNDWITTSIYGLKPLGILDSGGIATVTASLHDSAIFAGTTNFGAVIITDTNIPSNPVTVPITLVIASVEPVFVVVNSSVEADAFTCTGDNYDTHSAPTNAISDSLNATAEGGCVGTTTSAATFTYQFGSSISLSGNASSVSDDPVGGGGDAIIHSAVYFTVGHKVFFSASWSSSGAGVALYAGTPYSPSTFICGTTTNTPSGSVRGSLQLGEYYVGGGADISTDGMTITSMQGTFQIDVGVFNGANL